MFIDIQAGKNLLLLSEHHAHFADGGGVAHGLGGIQIGLSLIDILDEIGEGIEFGRRNALRNHFLFWSPPGVIRAPRPPVCTEIQPAWIGQQKEHRKPARAGPLG